MVRVRRQTKLPPDRLRRLADEELMRLVGENDPYAFQVVLERHAGAAFALASRILRDRALAEDAVQEAFISLWRSGARYDSALGSVRNWTLQIVHRRAIDALRGDGNLQARQVVDDELPERLHAAEQTDVEAVRRDEAQRLRGALRQLPQEQSRVIELAYFSGFTHTEISEILDLPVGTVKGRMRLGLQKLRYHLPAREALL